MEMNNIMVLDKRPELVKNIPLYSLLFKQCETAEKRSVLIQQLAIDYIDGSNEAGALELLRLVWPSILESTLLKEPDGRRYFNSKEGKDAYTLYSLDLTISGEAKLDEALVKYSKCLDNLVLTVLAHLKPQAPVVPEEFIELAAKDMLRAAHIMSDPKTSGKFFGCFIGRMVGYHYPVESCGLMKKAPRILRESFQNLSERQGLSIAKNLLEYMFVLDDCLGNFESRVQGEVLNEVGRVVGIGLCHNLNPHDVRLVFINAAKAMNGQQ